MSAQITNGRHTNGGSNLLAEAIQQIDGVIAGARQGFCNGNVGPGSPKQSDIVNQAHISSLLLDMRNIVEQTDNKTTLFTNLPKELQRFVKRWIAQSIEPKSYGHINDIGNLEDKIRRLESDKDSLILQSNVLGEQVDAQTEKIIELETILRERGSRLEGAANMLHTEELSRRALETHKLDLMAEISSLKLKLATAEKTRRDADERYLHSQRQIEQLQCRLNDRTVEVGELRVKMKNGTIPGSFDSSGNYSENYNLYPGVKLRQSYHGTFPGSFPGSSATARLGDGYSSYNGSFNSGRTLDKDRTIDRLRRKHAEVDKLKKAVEALAEANEEKDRSLDEMRKVLRRYKKLEEFMFSGHGRQAMDGIRLLEDELSDSSRQTSGSSDSGRDARRMRQDNMPHPNATSTPGNHVNLMSPVSEDHTLTVTPPSTIMSPTRSPGRLSPNERLGSGSNDVFFPRTPPASARRRLEASTLPKDHRPVSPIKSQIQSLPRKKGFASFGKGFFKLRTGKWSTSAPNLGDGPAFVLDITFQWQQLNYQNKNKYKTTTKVC